MLKTILCATALTAALPALAQDARQVERRVDRLETEMRAVQRKVFPGGDKRFFEPEFQPTDQATAQPAGVPATSPVADLTARVDTLERQLRTVTGQVEQANFRLRQMEESLAKFRADAEFRLTQLEGGAPAPAGTGTSPAAPAAPTTRPAAPPAAAPVTPPAPDAAAAAPTTGTNRPAATAAPAARPADPVEAAYQAAYLHYSNQQYPRAEAALADFVAKNPKHRRASHAQYWLGRTFLAQKQPAQAAKAFLDNYRNLPRGERAPDSLYWLGQSLMSMSPPQPTKACEVYAELTAVYGDKLGSSLKGQVDKARTTAKCAA